MGETEKPTTAFALSLVGGILGLLAGIALGLLGAVATFFVGGIGGIFGAYIAGVNAIILVGAIMLYQNPNSAHTWGIIILILSIIGGLNIFALIGGILAMTWKPSGTSTAVGAQPISRICPQCGRVLEKDVKFCPYCGKNLEK